MAFRHIAMYRWVDPVDADHIDRVRAAFDALPRRIAGLRRLDHGADVGVSERAHDYLVVAEFDSIAEWRAFRDHPDVVLLEQELLVGHAVDIATGQLHTGPGAESMIDRPPGDMIDVAGFDGVGEGTHESDDELMERARRAAMVEMQALLAEPDDPPTT